MPITRSRDSSTEPSTVPHRAHDAVIVGVMLTGSTLWGLYWLPLRRLEQAGLGGLWAIALVYLGATVAFGWPARRHLGALRRAGWRPVGIGLTAAVTSIAFGLGMIEGEVARVMILFYLSPIWSVLLGRLLLRERLAPVTLPALALALLGAGLLLWPEHGGLLTGVSPTDLLGLLAGVGFALTNVQLRAARRLPGALKNLAACALTPPLAAALAVAGGVGLTPPAWTVPAALLVGLIWMSAMTAATQFGVSRLPLQRSSVLLLFELVVGAVSAALLAGETLRLGDLGGGAAIVLAGLAVVWFPGPGERGN
jgi:drug/metabolite transporter (DMT)-like permease